MKKNLSLLLVVMLFLSVALPLSWAAESEAKGTGMTGTPQDFSDIEKTLKTDKLDDLTRRVADLEQANRFLTQRMQDLERTVYDFKSRQ